MKSTSTRCALLDELRGLDLISMMLYHGMWDLVYLFGVRAPWYGSWQGELWQQSICWVFILLSGFCLPLGRHPVKRGAVVFGCGALVTAVTLIFMPADAVWFGVLTLLGSAMIITGLLEKWMEKVPPVVGLAGSMFLFYFTRYAADGYLQLGHWLITLPGFLYANYFTAYLGFYPFGFFSTDYFPLTPWLFLFWAGFYLHHLAERTAQSLRPLRRSVCPPLGWLGRNSLMLYLLHQPVIYGVLTMVFLPISFGPIQFRISELLCVLPYFTPAAIPGLFIGCLLANFLGGAAALDVAAQALHDVEILLRIGVVAQHARSFRGGVGLS